MQSAPNCLRSLILSFCVKRDVLQFLARAIFNEAHALQIVHMICFSLSHSAQRHESNAKQAE